MNKGYLYAFFTALCWSTAGLFVKFINQSAFVITGYKALIALLFNLIFMRKKLRVSLLIIGVGMVQFMVNFTFAMANQMTSVGNAIVLQYSSMIFVLIYESIEKKRLPYLYQIIVIILAMIGMTVFFQDSISFESTLGNALAIISGAFFGLQFFLNADSKANAESSLMFQYIISILFMLGYMAIKRDINFTSQDVLFIGLGGLFQTALAGVFFSLCIRRIPAFTANVICMSEIAMAPLWAYLLLQETFSCFFLIGSLIMIVALMYNVTMEYRMKHP